MARVFITCEIKDQKLLKELDAHATLLHVRRSDIIRMALYHYCEDYNECLAGGASRRQLVEKMEVMHNGN